MPCATTEPRKPKPLYTATGADYRVEWYDFQFWKRSDPPPGDTETALVEFPHKKTPAV